MRCLSFALLVVLSCSALATAAPVVLAEENSKTMSALIERKTIAELEAENTLRLDQLWESDRTGPRAQMLVKPFGGQNDRWEALKTRMQPGDELWTFASSDQSWRDLAGRAGIALVRDGEIIDQLITMMN
jgi:hypothetical protein